MDYERFLSAEAKRFTNASLAGLVHRFAGVEGVISLAAGLPPAEAFPLTQLTASTGDGQEVVLGAEGRQSYLAQQYNFNPQGYDPLLDWLRNLTVALHHVHIAHMQQQPQHPPQQPEQQQQQQQRLKQQPQAKPTEPEAAASGPAADGNGTAAAAPAGPVDVPAAAAAATAPAAAAADAAQAAVDAGANAGADGRPCRDLVLTSGAIHAIFAIISCLTDPGDTLVVDEYTYTHALECVFLPRGLRLLPVRGDEEGLDPDDLDRQLRQAADLAETAEAEGRGWCRRPRLLYTIPTGHNPTGAVMSERRKRRILQLAEAHDLLVLEDDAYYWLHYPAGSQPAERQPGLAGLPPSILSLDSSGRVIRVDTFSKMLGPGYRLGWITAPQPLLGKLANWVQASTVGPCSVTQVLVTRLLQQWGPEGFKAHVQKLQALYASRASAAHQAACAHLQGLAEWQPPRAGMFMWLQLTGGLDAGSILDELVAAKVVVVPGSMFATRGLQATLGPDNTEHPADDGAQQRGAAPASPCLRLSFAGCPPEVFAEGIARLAGVIRKARAREVQG
ncbi:hypothetical protein PLESTB_001564000 [Pleodorina starrii]|uniref:Aminotransferase class I/classII large domain-containing protein n=1 Tax=Pleodorina starrii TaxID=330485 RepID=A0A9W6F8X0_9CHLO|nr:hypothetical protein PLESTB_001564000 [Pleodorina starrii]GLC72757.1 hypothetical protein PLESTF_001290100 [Pleodorina starrii]